MALQAELGQILSRQPDDFTEFSRDLPAAWIEEALQESKAATLRRRRLPAEMVVWLVVGLALFRNRSVVWVVDSLGLQLGGGKPVAPSAVTQARQRLGPDPIKWLFQRVSSHWAHQEAAKDTFAGMPLYALDGVTLRLPDSAENRAEFGGPSNSGGNCADPMVRMVCLLAARARIMATATFGTYHQHEQRYAVDVWEHLPAGSLVLFDKGLYSATTAARLKREGKHFLCRLPSNIAYEVTGTIAKDDRLVRIALSRSARKADPDLPEFVEARLIRTRAQPSSRKDGGAGQKRSPSARQYILTSVVDPSITGGDLTRLYRERWESELSYDEVKTELLDREETLRSKTPNTVKQEIWGLLLAYNLIRVEMTRVAAAAKVAPARISFVGACTIIRDEFIWLANAAPGVIPKAIANMRKSILRLVLPPRRPRAYPRAVKAERNRYPTKLRRHRRGRRRHRPPN